MLPAGKYKATLAEHHVGETSKGDPQVVATFNVVHGGLKEQISWFGFFTEKTQSTTIKSLITLGLQGNNPAGPLTIGKEVELVVENETDQKGVTRAKVRWVNPLGVARKVIPTDMAKAKLSALEGAVMAARQQNSAVDSDEIPF